MLPGLLNDKQGYNIFGGWIYMLSTLINKVKYIYKECTYMGTIAHVAQSEHKL